MSSRPFGVLVLGALSIAIAIVYIIIALQLFGVVIFGDAPSGSNLFLSGLLALIVGVIFLGAGWALWQMRPWALVFVMILAVFGLVEATFIWIATRDLSYGLAAAIIPGFLLWYTSRADVKAAFGDNA